MEKLQSARELDIYSIEMDENGNKQIHILGYTYYGDQWELTDICWFIEPLEEFIQHIADNKHYVDEQSSEYKQYILDCTEEEIVDLINHYFDGNAPDQTLPYEEITIDTPCGNYIC